MHWSGVELNEIQEKCHPVLVESDQNVLISAPTGSGKTICFEFALHRHFQQHPTAKAVYIAPLRAICQEKYENWCTKFSNCNLLIKDSPTNDYSSSLYIATPEKWDHFTRSGPGIALLKELRLILIDEVHILNNDRGAVLEIILSRMKCVSEARIVAVSATVPNCKSVAAWLNHAKIIHFPDSMRPVPLMCHVIGTRMQQGQNAFTFEYSLNSKLPELLFKHSDSKPTLIFCSTRKSAFKTAEYLKIHYPTASRFNAPIFDDAKLGETVAAGHAFHHAGLSLDDRQKVESLFKDGKIKALCSTSTLAAGVNLPAHLVIIKSTQQYNGSQYCEYDDLDILQMMGRAGRKQYDDYGVVVILTEIEKTHIYQSLTTGKVHLKSRLQAHCAAAICHEIAIGTIQSLSMCLKWFKSTFLYQSILSHPTEFFPKVTILEKDIIATLDDISANLARLDLIRELDGQIKATELGISLMHQNITLPTVKYLAKSLEQAMDIGSLLRILCQSPEFREIRYSPGDKACLHKIASHTKLRFIADRNLIAPWLKVFYLIQVSLQADLDDCEAKLPPAIRESMEQIHGILIRLVKFVIDYCACKQLAITLRNALELLSSLVGRSWPDDPNALRQVPGIGRAYFRILTHNHIASISDLRKLKPHQIEVILRRNPPLGKNLHDHMLNIPAITIRAEIAEGRLASQILVKCSDSSLIYHILILGYGHTGGAAIRFYAVQPGLKLANGLAVAIDAEPEFKQYSISVVSENFAGVNEHAILESKTWMKQPATPPRTGMAREKRPISAETFDLLSSDLDLPDDLSSLPSNVQITPPPTMGKANSCMHKCKDKMKCEHVCCKKGLLLAKGACEAQCPIPKRPRLSSLAASQRTISNAREWLRKYSYMPAAIIQKEDQFDRLYDEIEVELRYQGGFIGQSSCHC